MSFRDWKIWHILDDDDGWDYAILAGLIGLGVGIALAWWVVWP